MSQGRDPLITVKSIGNLELNKLILALLSYAEIKYETSKETRD